ncbi:MAG: hypothetical protein Q9198_003019 [Flavoplaca austrocitrina]
MYDGRAIATEVPYSLRQKLLATKQQKKEKVSEVQPAASNITVASGGGASEALSLLILNKIQRDEEKADRAARSEQEREEIILPQRSLHKHNHRSRRPSTTPRTALPSQPPPSSPVDSGEEPGEYLAWLLLRRPSKSEAIQEAFRQIELTG